VHLDGVALHDDGLLRITAPAPGVLRLAGELDLSNRAAAAAALEAAVPDGGRLELDLASLRFLDAGGAAALLGVAARSAAGGLLRVRRVRPPVLRILELVDLGGALVAVDGGSR
jgi:anti-anti-sigma factor